MRIPVVKSVLASAGLAIVVAACGPPEQAAREEPPSPAVSSTSIVLISIDTLRSDRLPIYGYDSVATPAIEALATDAIVFERAYSHSPLTMPSHASILTGLLPPQHGVRDNIGYRLEPRALATYLPRQLQDAGYATAAAVSAYVLLGRWGFADGFDVYDDAIEARPRAAAGGLQRPGRETLERILPWLRQRGGEPFFLFLHLFEPHTPYDPPAPFAARYASPYDGEVAAADAVVGLLIAELRRLDLYQQTAIVLLSDHGEGLGDHGEDEHGVLLYRESLQVPLVVKLPDNREAGRRATAPVALVDVFPTLAAVAGLTPSGEIVGRSLLATLADGGEPRALYAETFYPRLHFGWSDLASLIDGRFHYIEGPDPELYDLLSDPRERDNLIGTERRVAARLREQLASVPRDLVAPGEVDDEARQALAALGYIGTTTGEGEDLPDPKRRLHTLGPLIEGQRAFAAGDFERAVDAYRRAVVDHPRALDAWEHLGRSLLELGRRREAFEAFQQALAISPSSRHLALASATLLLEAGRAEEALDYLRAQIVLAPDEPRLRLLEARALLVAGQREQALARAEELAQRAPDNADAVYLRGSLRIATGELDRAEADLRRALELSPDHTAALSDLAALVARRGDLGEARRLLVRAAELRPGDERIAAALRRLGSP